MAKRFVELAHDTGAVGVKVRPNGLAKGVPRETTIQNIAAGLRAVGDHGYVHGVEIWLEVHGAETQVPATTAEIMRATNHKNVGLCWNSNPTDVIDGSVKANFELLRYAEHILASAIGAASSRLVLSLLLRQRSVSTRAWK